MAPRKKPNISSTAASRKSNSKVQPQPSKFSIQHFFERHTQNSQNPRNPTSSNPHNPEPPVTDSSTTIAPDKQVQNPARIEATTAAVASGNAENRPISQSSNKNSTQETPTENVVAVRFMDVEPNADEEATPDISKSRSAKRFRFSPGMVCFHFLLEIFEKLVICEVIICWIFILRVSIW